MRLLIAAGDSPSDPHTLPPGITALTEAASAIHVVTATLVGPLQWLTGDIDNARQVADERLATILGQLATAENSAQAALSGSRGDELPMTAFADAIMEFTPHHILIAYPKQNRSAWQDRNLVEKLFERFALPITIFEVP